MPSNILRTVIVEDEPQSRKALIDILEMMCPEVAIVGTADSVEEGVKVINDQNPELLFLDIQLGNQRSFELLERLSMSNAHVVFVTAFNDFAEEAFRFSAVDYLLKPINPDRLKEAVDRVKFRAESSQPNDMLSILKENLGTSESNRKKIVLPTLEMMHVVEISQIILCHSSVNYTIFYLEDKRELLISKTLKQYEDQLTPCGFFRVHRSWLVNLEHIKGYDRREGGFLMMSNGTQVPVSTQKREELLKLIR